MSQMFREEVIRAFSTNPLQLQLQRSLRNQDTRLVPLSNAGSGLMENSSEHPSAPVQNTLMPRWQLGDPLARVSW